MKNLMFLFLLSSTLYVFAQECKYNDLSDDFKFEIEVSRIPRRFSKPDVLDSCTVHLKIFSKYKEGFTHGIKYWPQGMEVAITSQSYTNCKKSHSYKNQKNVNLISENDEYDDLIVADFNFDGLEDVAIKRFENQNAIPKYTFFIQRPDCEGFDTDLFLTYEVAYLPDQIDYQNKMLSVAICKGKMDYKYYPNLKKWRIVSSN